MPTPLFISYAPADQRYFHDLEQHLRPLHLQGRITYWHAGMTPAGADWRSWRRDKLDQAQLILCLISADYQALMTDEMDEIWQRARAGARVIPVLVRPSLLEGTPFAALSPLPADGTPISLADKKDKAILDVVRGLLAALAPAPSSPASPPPPAESPAAGVVPTATTLRRLINEVLYDDAKLESFCSDEYPEVKRQFTQGMLRDAKVTLLLEAAPRDKILALLEEAWPEKVAQHRGLLKFR